MGMGEIALSTDMNFTLEYSRSYEFCINDGAKRARS